MSVKERLEEALATNIAAGTSPTPTRNSSADVVHRVDRTPSVKTVGTAVEERESGSRILVRKPNTGEVWTP